MFIVIFSSFCAVLLSLTNCLHADLEKNSSAIIKQEWISPNITPFDCHSSSFVETQPASFCVVWKGGSGEGKSNTDMKKNVGVWSSRFEEGHWTTPVEIVKAPESVVWTPVLAKQTGGELFLFYRIGPSPRQAISLMKRSQDNGRTWSEPEVLPAGIVGPTRTSPIVDQQGIMICGSSVESGEPKDLFKATACWIEIYEAGTWKKYGPLTLAKKPFGVIEPVLFYDQQNCLRMLCRDRSLQIGETGWIQMSKSWDGGKTWSDFIQTSLPNPDSGLAVADMGTGKILLVYNHSHDSRFPLNLALSLDGGDTWKKVMTLENRSGEFPTAIVDSSGFVHVTYASQPPGALQRRIKHVVIDPSKLFE